eukprot:m.4719 g.4719  ORF g.4719 m.4719 type:complete len:57 (-) comp4570_c0_seq1:5362-5532(-)
MQPQETQRNTAHSKLIQRIQTNDRHQQMVFAFAGNHAGLTHFQIGAAAGVAADAWQ